MPAGHAMPTFIVYAPVLKQLKTYEVTLTQAYHLHILQGQHTYLPVLYLLPHVPSMKDILKKMWREYIPVCD